MDVADVVLVLVLVLVLVVVDVVVVLVLVLVLVLVAAVLEPASVASAAGGTERQLTATFATIAPTIARADLTHR